MKTFSEALREAREEQGFTLEDLARTTKISLKILKALETGDFDVLPQTYIKGFLRTYAREVGLDENAIISAFEAQRKATREVFFLQQQAEKRPRRRSPWLIIGGLSGICLIIAAGYFIQRGMPPERRPSPTVEEIVPPPMVETDSILFDAGLSDTVTGASKIEEAVQDTEIITPAQNSIPPGQDLSELQQGSIQEEDQDVRQPETTELILKVESLSDTWVRVLTDGSGVYEGIMRIHSSATWKADSLFELKIGRAAGVRLVLNGQVLGDLGDPDQIVTELILNKDGIVKKTLR